MHARDLDNEVGGVRRNQSLDASWQKTTVSPGDSPEHTHYDDVIIEQTPSLASEHKRELPAATTEDRLGFLDGFRALSALYVCIHHTFFMAYEVWADLPKHYSALWSWALFGSHGVTAFIILAGYSLALGVVRLNGRLPGGLKGYIVRRSLRVLPPYWIALIIAFATSLLVGQQPTRTLWDLSQGLTTSDWILNAFLLQDIVPILSRDSARSAAYTLWSVPVEYHLYVILPLIIAAWKWSNWKVASVLSLVVGICAILITLLESALHEMRVDYFFLFIAGAVASIALGNARTPVSRLPWPGITFTLATLTLATHVFVWPDAWIDSSNTPATYLIGVTAIAFLMSMHLGHFNAARQFLSHNAFRVLAASSYTLYLIHAQLLVIIWKFVLLPLELSRPLQLLIGWTLVVPLIVGVSLIASRWIEKPFVAIGARFR